jgi:hypothetical protein
MHKFILTLLVFTFLTVAMNAQTAKLLSPNGGEVFRTGTSQDLRWDTTGTLGMRWRFQFSISPNGPWQDLTGATNILDSAARRGIFAGGFRVPAYNTSTGYVRMIEIKSDGTLNDGNQDRNDQAFQIIQPDAVVADSILRTPITQRVELSNRKIYGLDGYVFVDDGGVLAIQPGTVIVGDTVGQNSAICVNRGGKIYANGTPELPIIMTSSAPPGQRAGGDWGGVLICGKASTNHPDGQAALEGGIADENRVRGWFGGGANPNDDDSSGVMRYVRIEFAGIAAAPNQELNSLTMGGVGSKTLFEYIQVSYANDDAFEWFGGTANAKYLIATGTLDDDFDGDNGWSGMVQFGIVQRYKDRADVSTSQAFEQDNDGQGSYNLPLTKAVFSNITAIGPLRDTSWTPSSSGGQATSYHNRFGAGIQLRRNNRTSIVNTILAGWPRGIDLLTSQSQAAAAADSIFLRNISYFGIKGAILNLGTGTSPIAADWAENPAFNNYFDKSDPMKAGIVDPFTYGKAFDARPSASSILANQTASFQGNGIVPIDHPFFDKVTYRGAFQPGVSQRWDLPWSEYDPVNAIYKAQEEKVVAAKLLNPNGGEVFRAGTSQDLRWDTTGTLGMRWRFQFSTSPNGPWLDLTGATNILDSAARRGVFAGGFRVPAINTNSGYVRMIQIKSDGTLNDAMQDRNDQAFQIIQPEAVVADSILRTPITQRVELSNQKIYGLDGYVFVDDGGVLAIQPGTVIVGDTVGQNSAICVNRGGKIYANGTPELPIIMTSSAPPGQRAGGDWGGVLICGKASTNHPDGQAALEGGIADENRVRGWFGGGANPNDDDSSGVMRYVRIEFAGIAAAPNQELNSLTMGGVGSKTLFEYIQVSYANDDAFEWFGGTANAKYLIATGTLDDDFDGDNGWSGMVQFGIVQRYKDRADVSTSQAFEQDNDGQGSYNLPLTKAVFSNITAIGPLRDTSWTPSSSGGQATSYHNRFGAGIQLRRNNRTSIVNTILAGWPRGIDLLTSQSQAAAAADSIFLRNISYFGIKGAILNLGTGTSPIAADWAENPAFNNYFDKSDPMKAGIVDPFTYGKAFDARPSASSILANQTASFQGNGIVPIDHPFFDKVTYRGAFQPGVSQRWDLPWSEYDPVNAIYKSQTSVREIETGDRSAIVTVDVKVSPVPVQQVAKVIYSIDRDSPVSIKFVDAFGNTVINILDNEFQTRGYYDFSINTDGLSQGVYFLQITTMNNNVTTMLPVIR